MEGSAGVGIDIHGWVEVRPRFHPPVLPDLELRRWDGIVKLDHLLARNTALCAALFAVGTAPPESALAARRGLPDDLSQEAEAAYLTDAEDPAAVAWPSWVTLEELQAATWESLGCDWTVLFALMGTLAAEYSGVRLVVWFDY